MGVHSRLQGVKNEGYKQNKQVNNKSHNSEQSTIDSGKKSIDYIKKSIPLHEGRINPPPTFCLQKYLILVYMRLKRDPDGEQVVTGFYDYFYKNAPYAEEEFEIYHNSKKKLTSLFSSIHARTPTGETLHIYVDYTVSTNGPPNKVLIEKTLGKSYNSEIYQYHRAENRVDYFYASKKEETHLKIPVTSHFHIAGPAAASSLLFIRNRQKEFHKHEALTLLTGQNKWSFEKAPSLKSVMLYKPQEKKESFKVGTETFQAHIFKIYENTGNENFDPETPHLEAYMDTQLNIPYALEYPDGTKISIKNWDYPLKN